MPAAPVSLHPQMTWDGGHFRGEGNLFQIFPSAANQGEKEKQVCSLWPPGQQREKGSQKQLSSPTQTPSTVMLRR